MHCCAPITKNAKVLIAYMVLKKQNERKTLKKALVFELWIYCLTKKWKCMLKSISSGRKIEWKKDW